MARSLFPKCIDHLPDGPPLSRTDGSLVTHAGLAGLGEHPWNEIVVDGQGAGAATGAPIPLTAPRIG